MRLLTQKEVGDAKAAELQRDLLRTTELNEQADQIRVKLSQAEADFSATLARHRTEWAQEEGEHAKRVTEMTKEVESLERRKEIALEPIILKERDADNLLKDARNLLNAARLRETDAIELGETLQDRLDELGEREQNIIANESRARMMVQGAERQQEQVKLQSVNLTEAIKNFASDKIEWERQREEEKSSLIMHKRSLDARKESLERTEEALNAREKRLIDREGVLKRNYERLKISPLKEEG